MTKLSFNQYLDSIFTEEQAFDALEEVTISLYDLFKRRDVKELMPKELYKDLSFSSRIQLLRDLEKRGYTGYDCGFVDITFKEKDLNSKEENSLGNLLELKGVELVEDELFYNEYRKIFNLKLTLYNLAENRNSTNLHSLLGLSHSQSVNFKNSVLKQVMKVIRKDDSELEKHLEIRVVMD